MSKPIPVFAFAFNAFAFTCPAFGAAAPTSPRYSGAEGGPNSHFPENPEAERFAAAWRVAPSHRRDFTVCVRASKAANAPGFRLLTGAGPQPRKFVYVWLHEIEERSEGFVGFAREPLGGVGSILSQRRISFDLPNIAHWALAPAAFAQHRVAPDSAEVIF